MPVKHADDHDATPYVRYLLAVGRPPEGRIHGWVVANVTGGVDNVSESELVARYGEALRAECAAAGFEPACDLPLKRQSAAARQAASAWAEQVLTEGRY